jgi:hypothetical protein
MGTSQNRRERAKFAPRSGPFTFTPCKASIAGAKSGRTAGFEKFPEKKSHLLTTISNAFCSEMHVDIGLLSFFRDEK